MFEHITTSDHIRFAPYTHAALTKGETVVLADGALVGFADHDYEADEAVELEIGVCRSVFRAATADVDGTSAVGGAVYVTPEGALTTDGDEGANFLIGIVTDTDGAVAFVKLG
jgi:hypothetical protein